MLIAIKFHGQERVYDVTDVEGWKNCIISLTRTATDFVAEYRVK